SPTPSPTPCELIFSLIEKKTAKAADRVEPGHLAIPARGDARDRAKAAKAGPSFETRLLSSPGIDVSSRDSELLLPHPPLLGTAVPSGTGKATVAQQMQPRTFAATEARW